MDKTARGFKGTHEKFLAERERLSEKYGVTSTQAGCYLSNYCDPFLCRNRHGRNCQYVEKCDEIFKGEREEESNCTTEQ